MALSGLFFGIRIGFEDIDKMALMCYLFSLFL